MTSRSIFMLPLLLAALLAPPAARAWGDGGHEVIADIAWARLLPATRARVERLLAADPDTLTAPDFAARATWADRWRDSDRNTTRERYEATQAWHFADIEIDGGSLYEACHGHPPLARGTPASAGPARACVVDKVDQFAAEWASRATPPAERLLALKFLLHFVGDLHQPLHVADHEDRGGNEVAVLHGEETVARNLHAYWDTYLVRQLGPNPRAIADALASGIGPRQARAWSAGKPADWALEANARAREVAYDFGTAPVETDAHGRAAQRLDEAYEARALAVVREQLARAGVRLALLLNAAPKQSVVGMASGHPAAQHLLAKN